MKRFIGWIVTAVGAVAAAFGTQALITGTSNSRILLNHAYSIDALTVGLMGLALLTIGLIWVRD